MGNFRPIFSNSTIFEHHFLFCVKHNCTIIFKLFLNTITQHNFLLKIVLCCMLLSGALLSTQSMLIVKLWPTVTRVQVWMKRMLATPGKPLTRSLRLNTEKLVKNIFSQKSTHDGKIFGNFISNCVFTPSTRV